MPHQVRWQEQSPVAAPIPVKDTYAKGVEGGGKAIERVNEVQDQVDQKNVNSRSKKKGRKLSLD